MTELDEIFDEQQGLPQWNWREMSATERARELELFAKWVASLQQTHGRWVRLPACWPLHRALYEELLVFWYWRLRLQDAPDASAEEAVRWHQSLRASAQVWAEAYGGCRHESVGEVDEKRDQWEARLAAARPYLDRAEGSGWLSAERDGGRSS